MVMIDSLIEKFRYDVPRESFLSSMGQKENEAEQNATVAIIAQAISEGSGYIKDSEEH